MTTINKSLGVLQGLRTQEKTVQEHIKEVQDKIAESTIGLDLSAAQAILAETRKEIKEAADEVRKLAEDDFEKTGNLHPHPAVEIRRLKECVYELELATHYCHDHLPHFLKMDKNLFEKHAKAVADTDPIPCVKIVVTPKAYIAEDLTKGSDNAKD